MGWLLGGLLSLSDPTSTFRTASVPCLCCSTAIRPVPHKLQKGVGRISSLSRTAGHSPVLDFPAVNDLWFSLHIL